MKSIFISIFATFISVTGAIAQDCAFFCDEGSWSMLGAKRMSALIAAGADVNEKNKNGTSVLTFAVGHETPEVVGILINAGADLHTRNDEGWSPLHIAAHFMPPEVTALFLEAGVDVNVKVDDGMIPLMLAAVIDSAHENVRLLIAAGANLNATEENGWTALHAAAGESPRNVLLLLEAGADGTIKNNDGDTPFDLIKDEASMVGSDVYLALQAASLK